MGSYGSRLARNLHRAVQYLVLFLPLNALALVRRILGDIFDSNILNLPLHVYKMYPLSQSQYLFANTKRLYCHLSIRRGICPH